MAIKNKHYLPVAKSLNIDVEELKKLSPDQIDVLVEKKIGHKLEHSNKFGNRLSRGNILLSLGKFIDRTILAKFDRFYFGKI